MTLLEQVKSKIDAIASTSSRKEKEQILAEISSDVSIAEEARAAFQLAYEPTIQFYIEDLSDLPEADGSSGYSHYSQLLCDLHERKISGNHAKQEIANFLASCSPEEQELIKRILKRDLRAGISATTINKAFPGLIYQHPYMRCDTLNSKTMPGLKYPAFSQVKMDGMYVDIVVDKESNKVTYMARSGNVLNFGNQARDEMILSQVSQSCVLMGEALVVDECGNYENRQTGNGHLNSDDLNQDLIRFVLWDWVPIADFRSGKSDIPYVERIVKVEKYAHLVDFFDLVVTKTINCEEDIKTHFKEVRSVGEEGTVVKNYHGLWKDGTSKNQLKVKVVAEVDLYITGWNPGEGKNEGLVGSVIARSSDDKVEVAISGFADADRKNITRMIDQLISTEQIITIKCNDLLTDANSEMLSLFLPRFVELRKDKQGKSQADSLNRIHSILENFELFKSV